MAAPSTPIATGLAGGADEGARDEHARAEQVTTLYDLFDFAYPDMLGASPRRASRIVRAS